MACAGSVATSKLPINKIVANFKIKLIGHLIIYYQRRDSKSRAPGGYGSARPQDPVIFTRSSSGRRSRISAGKQSWPRRAPNFATSTTAVGAGVATATTSQSNVDNA